MSFTPLGSSPPSSWIRSLRITASALSPFPCAPPVAVWRMPTPPQGSLRPPLNAGIMPPTALPPRSVGPRALTVRRRETGSGGEETSLSSAASYNSASSNTVAFTPLLPQGQLVWAVLLSEYRGCSFCFSPPRRHSAVRPPPHCRQWQRYSFLGFADSSPQVRLQKV